LFQLKVQGYHVAVYYFALSSSSLAIRRVKHRVALGGHDVPTEVVKRRFGRSLHNFFQLYAGVADEWMMFNNSSGHTAQTVAYQTGGQSVIQDKTTWRKLHTLARS
jgi:predicted ABC-type ATPase